MKLNSGKKVHFQSSLVTNAENVNMTLPIRTLLSDVVISLFN